MRWRGECDPVPSVHAHAPGEDDADSGAADLSVQIRPILLVDIDRILEDSANVEHRGDGAPIRTWRDELTLVLESLTYARAILAADAAILLHSSAPEGADPKSVVDELPRAMDTGPWDDQWSGSDGEDVDPELGEDLFTRTDQLLAAHQEMARVDLSSPADVTRALQMVEEQLTALTERQEAVAVRLQQIRAAVIRQYERGGAPAHDQPA